jgi:hypothetical protein
MDEETQRLVKLYGLDNEARRRHHESCMFHLVNDSAKKVLETEKGKLARRLILNAGGFYYSSHFNNPKLIQAKILLSEELGDLIGEKVYNAWGREIEHDLDNFYDI